MLKLLMSAAIAIPLLSTAVSAQPYGYGNPYNARHPEVRREIRDCNRELRHARNRWEYQHEMRECRREIAQARRDARWNDRYYRNGYRNDYRYDHRYGYYGNRW